MSDFVKETSIPGLFIIERPTFRDGRGFFREVFHLDELEQKLGKSFKIVQLNHSLSKPNVIRGLHADRWNKLVYPLTGKAFAAITDIRPDFPTFSKVETFEFDDENRYALFIPRGLANSVCADGKEVVNYIYLVDDYYDPKNPGTTSIVWNDPDLKIPWPLEDAIISERDRNNPRLRDLFPAKFSR